MSIHHNTDAPTDHIGHYAFPEDCILARVENCPGLTSVTFPDTCNYLWVHNCIGLTSITFPDTCETARIVNCPNLTHINEVRVNSAAEAEPYLREIAKHALQDDQLVMEIVRYESDGCGSAACIAGWAGILFPELVRPGYEMVDAIPVLGNEAASMFFKTTPEARAFLERFMDDKP